MKVTGLTKSVHFDRLCGYVTFGGDANCKRAADTGRDVVILDGDAKAKLFRRENLALVVREDRA